MRLLSEVRRRMMLGALHEEAKGGRGSGPQLTAPRRVLLADDNDDVRDLLKTALELDGYEVVDFRDGTGLVDYLGATPSDDEDPDLLDIVLSDIRMPHASGIDVLAAVRNTRPEIPVILMTAYGNPEIDAEARRLGAATVFLKPFDLDDLRTALLYFGRRDPARH
jgi:two-component system response regulator (stage 0 sporulation protein F)